MLGLQDKVAIVTRGDQDATNAAAARVEAELGPILVLVGKCRLGSA